MRWTRGGERDGEVTWERKREKAKQQAKGTRMDSLIHC